MFLISFKPTVPPEQLDAIRPDHMAWAARGFEAGVFVAGGRRMPPTGGVILAIHDRKAVSALIDQEPFCRKGLAEIDLQEIEIMSTAPGLEKLKQGQAT
jgi:uncharacterized protein YciI